VKKALIKSIFERIKYGGLRVVYWDGEEVLYGDQSPEFHLIFNQPPPLNFNIDDPMVGFGEAYMDGIIDFQGTIESMILLMEKNRDAFLSNSTGSKVLKILNSAADKLQQKNNIAHHYDLGNDFFALWLDETMCYSCAYFEKPEYSLHEAQIAKIDHILKKLNLKQGERLLDIGCGWGWLIIKAAQQFGVKALGITLSEEQYRGDKERIAKLGLEDQVEVKLANYLDLDEKEYQFDKIVSVGMFEHVGKKNLPLYMDKVNRLLVSGGLSLLHTITGTTEDIPTNSWMKKYIFPGGYAPSMRETVWLLPEYNFHLLHAEGLRLHYAKTLDCWYKNFSDHIEEVRQKFDERFIRMWSLYLRGCAATFRVTGLNVYQLLFSKGINNDVPITFDYIYHSH